MTVYVDNARIRYGQMLMCHMVADRLDELHAMADRIGIRRKWFHGGHYNICQEKRALAIKAGAVGITPRQAAKLRRKLEALPDMHTSAIPTSFPPRQAKGQRQDVIHSELCPLSLLSTARNTR